MKVFHCDCCDQLVFFESVQCLQCGSTLGYAFDLGQMIAVKSTPSNDGIAVAADDTPSYRPCRNYLSEQVCNWLVAENDDNELCVSCRLTSTVPDVSIAENRVAWGRLEAAKRRLVYQLAQLKLPLVSQVDAPDSGMAFEFLADPPDGPRVVTGHADGKITINLAETNDAEREHRRVSLHEPYRTLLGHLRHEVGHYYWDRLIRDSDRLLNYRDLFGDERADYAEAMQRHYDNGPPPDWQLSFVSAYASMHPWEDWAETWAHYLHLTDTLETARACGLMLRPHRPDEPVLNKSKVIEPVASAFDHVIDDWLSLTYILNNLNRGMGLPDGYPFVLSPPAINKLRFIHETIA